MAQTKNAKLKVSYGTTPLNEAVVLRILRIIDKGLSEGLGEWEPGNMCVEAAINYSLNDETRGDRPVCVAKCIALAKIGLNDSHGWYDEESRAQGLRAFAIAQLGTNGGDFDAAKQKKFVEMFAIGVAKHFTRKTASTLKEAVEAMAKWNEKENNNVGMNPDGSLETDDADQYELKEIADIGVKVLRKLKSPGSKFLYLVDRSST